MAAEGADWLVGTIIGLTAVVDCEAIVVVAGAPVELIIGCPGCSIGVVRVVIGAIIGLVAVTDCRAGIAAVPAGRIIAGVDAGVALRMIGAADTADPDWGDGALPFDLMGCTAPPLRIRCAPAVA